MTNEQVGEIGTLLLEGRVDELAALAQSGKAPVLQHWMATLILKSIETGAANSFQVLLDRIVGKVREQRDIELTGKDGGPLAIEHDPAALEKRIKEIDAVLAQAEEKLSRP